MLQETDGLTSY